MTLLINQEKNIITVMKKLESQLENAISVNEVYRKASKEEINNFLNIAKQKDYEEAWTSLFCNTKLVIVTRFDPRQENYYEIENIKSSLQKSYDLVKDNVSFPSELFSDRDNKTLLISVSSLLVCFVANGMPIFNISDIEKGE